jgi:DNA-binding transcriptional ArsR family regulator
MPITSRYDDPMAEANDSAHQAAARALSSPLRMRILRFCLHEGRTNREIAVAFDLNPGTSLHHVRTLLDTGFLAAQEPRTGKRGATEIPYLATKRSFGFPVPLIGPVLVQAFLEEIQGVAAEDLDVSRLGVKLNAASERELHDRLAAVLLEFKERPSDPDGRPISIMVATHPEVRRGD